MKIESS